MDMIHVATDGCPLYAVEIPGEGGEPPRLLMRSTGDPWTFTALDSAARIALTCGKPGACVVGLSVTSRRVP